MPRHPGRSGHAWRKALLLLYQPDPLICWLCGDPIDKTLKYPHPWSKSGDHIITLKAMRDMGMTMPEQRALALDPNNLRPAHLRHNIARGARPPQRPTAAATTRHTRQW